MKNNKNIKFIKIENSRYCRLVECKDLYESRSLNHANINMRFTQKKLYEFISIFNFLCVSNFSLFSYYWLWMREKN